MAHKDLKPKREDDSPLPSDSLANHQTHVQTGASLADHETHVQTGDSLANHDTHVQSGASLADHETHVQSGASLADHEVHVQTGASLIDEREGGSSSSRRQSSGAPLQDIAPEAPRRMAASGSASTSAEEPESIPESGRPNLRAIKQGTAQGRQDLNRKPESLRPGTIARGLGALRDATARQKLSANRKPDAERPGTRARQLKALRERDEVQRRDANRRPLTLGRVSMMNTAAQQHQSAMHGLHMNGIAAALQRLSNPVLA